MTALPCGHSMSQGPCHPPISRRQGRGERPNARVNAVMEVRGSVPPVPPEPVPAADAADTGSGARPYEGAWRFTAPAVESSVPQARHAVRDLIARCRVPADDDLLHGLLLIVSELVGNAVRHAALLSPKIAVELTVTAGWVRVGVEDRHPYLPRPLHAEPDQSGGRGLMLVHAIATAAGGCCDAHHTACGGKVVWAALPLTAG